MNAQLRRPVAELLRRIPPLREDMTVGEAAPLIAAAQGGLPVVDASGKLVGYMGETDLLKAIIPGYLRDLHDTDFFTRDLSTLARCVATAAVSTVAEHMSTATATVDEDDSETHAAELFLHNAVRSLPVLSPDGAVLGVLRLADLITDLMAAGLQAGPAPEPPKDE